MQAKTKEQSLMTTQSVALQRPYSPSSREAQLLAANLVFVGVAVFYLLVTNVGRETIRPLVQADPQTSRRIQDLERILQQNPRASGSALELAQIYREAGEFPFSYDALRESERTGTEDPGWRLSLGLAYLELGKNDDGLRVLTSVERRCQRPSLPPCPSDIRARLDIYGRIARLLKARRIESHKHGLAAQQAIHEVLRPVEVDLAKMRPKAPATPASRPVSPPAAAQ